MIKTNITWIELVNNSNMKYIIIFLYNHKHSLRNVHVQIFVHNNILFLTNNPH